MLKHKFLPFLLFLIPTLAAFQWNYVDGDDTYLIVHHIIHNFDIQKPYGSFLPAFNAILRFFSTTISDNPETVKAVSYSIIIICNCLYIFVMTKLIWNYLQLLNITVNRNLQFWLPFLFVVISPDFILSGLYINPSLCAMTLLMLSNICVILYIQQGLVKYLIFAIVLFGIGCGFRWDAGLYLTNILFLLLCLQVLNDKMKFWKLAVLGILFVLSYFLFAVYLYGYSFNTIINFALFGRKFQSELDFSIMGNISTGLALFTPACVILLLIGIIECIRSRQFIVLLTALIVAIPLFYINYTEILNPKRIIIIIPSLFFLVTIGIDKVLKMAAPVQYAIGFIIVLPWIVGVKINEPNTVWGPAFDTKLISRTKDRIHAVDVSPDHRYKLNNTYISLTVTEGGMILPTTEGHRPIYGYGAIIFGGKWRGLHRKREMERQQLYAALPAPKIVLQETDALTFASTLIEKGYVTIENHEGRPYVNPSLCSRDFNKGPDKVRIIYPVFGQHARILNREAIDQIFHTENVSVVGCNFLQPSYLMILLNQLPDDEYRLIPVGSSTCMIYKLKK